VRENALLLQHLSHRIDSYRQTQKILVPQRLCCPWNHHYANKPAVTISNG
jgi:hypothetical protein